MKNYVVKSCVRGYNINKDAWEANIGEDLPCQHESGNTADPFTVAAVKNGVTAGHIPQNISSVSLVFL